MAEETDLDIIRCLSPAPIPRINAWSTCALRKEKSTSSSSPDRTPEILTKSEEDEPRVVLSGLEANTEAATAKTTGVDTKSEAPIYVSVGKNTIIKKPNFKRNKKVFTRKRRLSAMESDVSLFDHLWNNSRPAGIPGYSDSDSETHKVLPDRNMGLQAQSEAETFSSDTSSPLAQSPPLPYVVKFDLRYYMEQSTSETEEFPEASMSPLTTTFENFHLSDPEQSISLGSLHSNESEEAIPFYCCIPTNGYSNNIQNQQFNTEEGNSSIPRTYIDSTPLLDRRQSNGSMVESKKIKIAAQLNYYFSIENLCKDTYLRSLFNPDNGGVELSELIKFRRMQIMTGKNLKLLLNVIKSGVLPNLELVNDDKCVRIKSWREWIL
ncbi:uncharacterized protein RJT20DRAFT_5255 [Scheffersomyces xylosifermentans]|uniref:uncharacterized protein n=1 Tax=Scheffersomyces xylosifermentans TaxID=1304137 RepID=UPI00315D1AF0